MLNVGCKQVVWRHLRHKTVCVSWHWCCLHTDWSSPQGDLLSDNHSAVWPRLSQPALAENWSWYVYFIWCGSISGFLSIGVATYNHFLLSFWQPSSRSDDVQQQHLSVVMQNKLLLMDPASMTSLGSVWPFPVGFCWVFHEKPRVRVFVVSVSVPVPVGQLPCRGVTRCVTTAFCATWCSAWLETPSSLTPHAAGLAVQRSVIYSLSPWTNILHFVFWVV